MCVQKCVRESDGERQKEGGKETAEKKELDNIPSGCACVIRFEWPEEWVRSEKKANKDRKLLLKV